MARDVTVPVREAYLRQLERVAAMAFQAYDVDAVEGWFDEDSDGLRAELDALEHHPETMTADLSSGMDSPVMA
ncbi:hypothetical protein [Deinococcus kurensis]|uniref:hypothetical protein n=1 Tax=Deinococcus kurensis TaxID=2662757 RepID=UPI0012D2F5C5|nr:hypothetical protein [Deinococcus kurensis]